MARSRKEPSEQSEHQAHAISGLTLQIGILSDKAEESRKQGEVSGGISILGNRLHGCLRMAQRVTGPRFPEPGLSGVACDSGYAHWLHGTQGRSLQGSPLPCRPVLMLGTFFLKWN